MILPTRLHQDRFQSTHPLRGATAPQEIMPHVEAISIHAPLAGCDQAVVDKKQDRRHISIHAPLAGCDFWLLSREAWIQISIHAPLAGCDLINSVNKEKVKSFQSTHPLRGATAPAAGKLLGQSFQSTHPLRGATCLLRILKSSEKFQSTHPLRGATLLYLSGAKAGHISIHAPLAGCDISGARSRTSKRYFNPRTPCGVRHCPDYDSHQDMLISIHAPLAGCDAPR